MSRTRPLAPWVTALADRPATPSQALVLDRLRSAIVSGGVPPGTPIPVDDVAAQFALSRIPVREALTTLVAEGLVEHQLRGAFVVARFTRAELAELYLVRAGLETAALAVAVPQATDADVERATAALLALEAATAAGDTAGHHRWSRAFHQALVAPCRMPRLLRMFDSAWNTTEPDRPMTHASATATAALAADHRKMLAGLAARDAGALTELMAVHYERLQQVVAAMPAD